MIRDTQIDSIRKRLYLRPLDLNALIGIAINEGGAANYTEGQILQNPDAASKTAPEVFQKEVSSFNITGIGFSATGSVINGTIKTPYDIDPKWPIGFRVNWTSTSGSGSATWALLTRNTVKGAALVVKGSILTALNTVFPASAVTVANGNEWSARGILNKLGLSRDQIEEGAHLQFTLNLSAVVTIAASSITFLGLEMDYVPVLTIGQGTHTDRPQKSSGIK